MASRKAGPDVGVCRDTVDLRTFPYNRDYLAVVTHPAHTQGTRKSVWFEATIDHEHVDIAACSIMKETQRSAAAAGKQMRYRIQVSTVDAAYRIVAAQLALAIVPCEAATPIQQALGLRVIPLRNAWAKRYS